MKKKLVLCSLSCIVFVFSAFPQCHGDPFEERAKELSNKKSKEKTGTIFDLLEEPDGEIAQEDVDWEKYRVKEWEQEDVENALRLLKEFIAADFKRNNWK